MSQLASLLRAEPEFHPQIAPLHKPVPPRIHATTEVDFDAAAGLLAALPSEACSHSWREMLPHNVGAADVQRLVEHEQSRRPTSFFWFWATEHGRRELFGVATIAERISAQFPIEGFPVIARSYVRPSYRGRGLYANLMTHRVRHCRLRFGATLRGIHFGTSDPKVVRSAHHNMPAPPICLGDELLALPEGQKRVGAYLVPNPRYLTQLRTELSQLDTRTAERCARFLDRGYERGVPGTVSGAYLDIDPNADVPGWHELVAFCSAIPVEP